MAGMFSKLVYNNIRPTDEEVQSFDLLMIEEFQLKEAESGFPSEITADCFDKRPAVDVQSQVDLNIQGFEKFSTVPLTEILKKAGLITDASTSHLTKKRKIVRFDSTTVEEQVYQKTPSFVSTRTVPTQKTASSGLEHVHDEKITPSSSLKSVGRDNSDEKWDDIKLFLQSYDVEGVNADFGPATLECLVAAVENQKPDNDNVGTSNMQLPLDFSDAVVAAHQAAKTPAKIVKRIRTRSKVFKSPYTTKYASGSKAIEDQIEKQKQQFTFDGFLISDTMSSSVIEEFKQWVEEGLLKFHAKKYYEYDTDTVLTTQQHYAESVRVALIEEAITHIIKGYCMPSDLPWHQVDEVYVPINCNENFHWVLAVIFLKDRCIRVYDSLSRRRNTKLITEIQKLAKMLPTYLSDSKFYDETSRTDWPNLETYRDKITQTTQILNEHPFNVEYVRHIMQQECDSVDCGVFVAGYAEYLSEEMNVPSDGFEAEYHRMRYATLFQNYGTQKAKKGYVSENDDPPRPKSRII
ncbi:putative protein EIN4-like [Capsicum annuum]|uniref:Ubiquitin-like protease family profile domain-containing protein n=1 Tax=Capsicum annuum TaxID=4072 RepID=A0A2G3ABF7_CAPAN|nr:putative protein EIN4-like [Capsicum annuum]KAF3648441.1 putative protein EIN4-like [Capsicum annuum]PHT91589.1 hypothetical protein T459_06702 [Capsicum annuum]